MLNIRQTILVIVSSSITLYTMAGQEDAPLGFYSIMDENCLGSGDGGAEAVSASLLLADVAVSTVLGVAKASLKAASETKTVIKNTHTGGFFLFDELSESGASNKQPDINNCIRFWYGRMANSDVPTISYQVDLSSTEESEQKSLKDSWAALQLAETPYVYGEIWVRVRDRNSGVFFIEPKRLFVRPSSEFSSFWKKAPKYRIAMDFVDLGTDKPFASYSDISFDNSIKAPLYSYGKALLGKKVGPFNMNITDKNPDGGFRIDMTLTSVAEGSKFAAALSDALESNKDEIKKAIVPETRDQKVLETQKLLDGKTALAKAYYKALEDAYVAANDLDNAKTESEQKIAVVKLQGARTLANLAAEKYGIAKPFS